MKKSLLVISVILLIAGLFISCNSEAAGTNSEVGYVKFGDSKALTASVTPESGPAISSLYWYYKATKTSGGIAIGQTDAWRRVNPNSTGLVGTIGPFSKGSWAFELVGTTSTTAPENTSYNPQGTAGSKWTIGDESVKYYGVSGTTDEETRTPITLTTGTTVIPVSLKWNKTSTTATVKFDSVSVLDSSTLMQLPAETTVYLTVKFGDDVIADNISATNTTAGSNVYYSNSTGLTISADILGTKNLYVEVYEDSARTSKVQEGSVGFTAAAGDTITITGNIGSLEAYYGEFLNSSKTAYVFNGSSFTYYDTLEAAIEAAADGDTVGLLKDVAYTSGSIEITKGITLEGNGHTITNTRTASGSDLNGNKSGRDAAVYLNNAEKTVSINNLNITTTNIGFIYVGTSDTNGTKADGGTINVSNCDFRTAGDRYGFFVNNCVNNLTVNINGSTLLGYAAIYSKSQHSAYNISNSTLYGYNTTSTAPSNGFGTVVIDAHTETTSPDDVPDNQGCYNTVVIDNCTIYAQSDSTNVELWLCLQYAANHNTVTVTDTHMYPAPSGTDEIIDYKWEYSKFTGADDNENGAQATNSVTVNGTPYYGFPSNHA